MRIRFKDIHSLIKDDEISIQISNLILNDIAEMMGYTVEDFSAQMDAELGWHINPGEFVDLVGLAVFIDDIGGDSNFFFDNYVVSEILIIDSEDGNSRNIGVVFE